MDPERRRSPHCTSRPPRARHEPRPPRVRGTLRPLHGLLGASAFLIAAIGSARGQWDPASGLWQKESAQDVRVMTFNVRDGLCSSNAKVEGGGNWCALARLVAALRPDVLLLQEAGDNDGNGTGPSADSAAALAATLDLFLHGGADAFHPGAPEVTSYVQLYAPGFDLPHVFVS